MGRTKPKTDDQRCEVIGVVSASGAYSREASGTHAHKKSDHGVGTTPLVAWRINGGPIESGNLVLEAQIDCSEDARTAFEAQFPSGTMVTASADKMPMYLHTMALLEANTLFVATQTDEELEREAYAITNPPPFSHPVLGEFKAHPKLPWEYYGGAKWDGYPIKVGIGYGEGPSSKLSMLQEQAERAAKFIAMQDKLADKIKAIIREQLYSEWCNEWLPKGETPQPVDEWAAQFKVGIICVADCLEIEVHLETEFHVDGYRPSISWTPDEGLSEAWVN
ncbi:MAG: hypothetical protein MK098_15200 [Marinovum sp.]|nr:hypothetical protein [Marinovum sp.]